MSERILKGVAVPWCVASERPHQYGNHIRFLKYAFTRSLQSGRVVPAIIDHDLDREIASTRDRFKVFETDRGLEFELTLDDGEHSETVLSAYYDGRLNGVSVGIGRSNGFTQPLDDGRYVFNVMTSNLIEVSICIGVQPALETTKNFFSFGGNYVSLDLMRKRLRLAAAI